ncbi:MULTISPECIES: hypothetical protein [Hyphomicrobiales]|jgi:hypothetical protein|uniref:Uncharacterized protein n=1 Tax=Bosea massiliensis TaxID=151419 RepID=A0ABW0P0X6_9HYPH|nr:MULTISPECIES: hypothetical protein [Hyphomicrobiales]
MMGHHETAEQRTRQDSRQDRRARVAEAEGGDDWPLMSGLLGGLFLAVLFNTFIALIPG